MLKGFNYERSLKRILEKKKILCFRITRSKYGDLICFDQKNIFLLEVKFYSEKYYPSKHRKRYHQIEEFFPKNLKRYLVLKIFKNPFFFIPWKIILTFSFFDEKILKEDPRIFSIDEFLKDGRN